MTSLINVEDILLIDHSELRQCFGICGVAGWVGITGTLKAIMELEARLALVLVV